MLSALQQSVAIVLAGLPEAEGFALAGGGALIVRGLIDRETHDLDFFAGEAEAVDRLLPALEGALSAVHLSVERRVDIRTPGSPSSSRVLSGFGCRGRGG